MGRVICRYRRFLAACMFSLLIPQWAVVRAQGEASAGYLRELEQVAEQYDVEVIFVAPQFPIATTHGKIDGQAADSKSLESYTRLFVPEFTLYPPELVKRARLARVVLCSELAFAGQRRNAIPDFEHDTLYLDVSRGSYSKPYLRTVIHHEFFHIIDYRDDGHVYDDEQWKALNSDEFRYGKGGQAAQDIRTASVLTDKFPGFLTEYSTTAVEEDKAEVFAHLIVHAVHVGERTERDKVLDAKVGRMKELLGTFCVAMNAEFWEKVRHVQRTEE